MNKKCQKKVNHLESKCKCALSCNAPGALHVFIYISRKKDCFLSYKILPSFFDGTAKIGTVDYHARESLGFQSSSCV